MKKRTLIRRKRKKFQENRIEYCKKMTNNLQWKEEMQIRAKMSDNNINVSEDAAVSEMIKRLSLKKIYSIPMCFRNVSWIR